MKSLIEDWIRNSPRKGSENISRAVDALEGARAKDSPAAMVTLICPNFEVVKFHGKRQVTIHDSLVHDERGNLRRGYAAIEEISAVHQGLDSVRATAHHAVIIVDNAIQWQPDGAENLTQQGVDILQKLAGNRLKNRGISSERVRVERLSHVIPKIRERFDVDFSRCWEEATQALWGILPEQHHHIAGLLRREISKETRYLMSVWGVVQEEEAKKSLIRDQYALTATIGRLLPYIYATSWETALKPRSDHILLDAISGPEEDPHNAEYKLYNGHFPELDQTVSAGDDTPLGILRVIANVALWSDRAVDAPLTGKTLNQLERESWEITDSGLVPD